MSLYPVADVGGTWGVQPKEGGQGSSKDGQAAVAIRMPYIRVVDIQDDSDGDTFTSSFT